MNSDGLELTRAFGERRVAIAAPVGAADSRRSSCGRVPQHTVNCKQFAYSVGLASRKGFWASAVISSFAGVHFSFFGDHRGPAKSACVATFLSIPCTPPAFLIY